jgi:hypothetical protein
LQDAFQDIGIAAAAEDIPGLHAGCEHMHDAAESLYANLPSPNPALTAALEAAMEDYHASSQYCDEAVHAGSVSDLNQAELSMSRGNDHMQQAIAVVQKHS